MNIINIIDIKVSLFFKQQTVEYIEYNDNIEVINLSMVFILYHIPFIYSIKILFLLIFNILFLFIKIVPTNGLKW